jgi:tagatose-1,6-bisphosphate aldolase non-catalytic subunit AgaZ/GatZ
MSNMKTITNETNIEELTRDKNRLLNELQASKLLGVSHQTLRQSIRYKGRIRYYKVNNRVSYKVQDVLDYLEACKIEPTN